MSMIDDIKRDRDAGTPGPWETPFDTFEYGWSLDTDGENSYVGVGAKRPLAIVAVESAFGRDDELDANARRLCRVPEMEAALIAADELARRAADAFRSEYHNTNHLEGAKEYFDSSMKILAAYRAKTSGDT